MTDSVVAQIRPGGRIVGLEALLTVSDRVASRRRDFNGRTVVIVGVVVVISVSVRSGQRTADQRARGEAWIESAATTVPMAAAMPATGPTATVPAAGSTTAANADAATTHARTAQDTATAAREVASAAAETAAAAHMAATEVTPTTYVRATTVTLRVAGGGTGKRQRHCEKGRCAEDFQFHFVLLYVRHIQSAGPSFVPRRRGR